MSTFETRRRLAASGRWGTARSPICRGEVAARRYLGSEWVAVEGKEGTSRGTYPVRTLVTAHTQVPTKADHLPTHPVQPPRQPTSTETSKGPFPEWPHFWDITLLPVLAARPPLCITKTSNHARPMLRLRTRLRTHVQAQAHLGSFCSLTWLSTVEPGLLSTCQSNCMKTGSVKLTAPGIMMHMP